MAGNGKIKINGNGKTPLKNTAEEIGGFSVAEVAGAVTSLGAMYLMQKVPDAILDPVTTVMGHVIQPVQVPLENFVGKICKLEECQPDKDKPVEERAKGTARAMLIAIPAIAAAWYAKFAIRRFWNKTLGLEDSKSGAKDWQVWKMTPEEKMLFIGDEGVHLASALAMQNHPMSDKTDNLIRNMTSTIQGVFGIDKNRAHDLATMIALHEIPNLLGAITAGGIIYGRHQYGWPNGWVGRVLGKKAEEEIGHGLSVSH